MWLKLFVSVLCMSANAASYHGPKSNFEAKLLWEEGRKLFEENKFDDASKALQRLVDRYPGKKGYLEAHELLGESYLSLGLFESALTPLKYFIEATPSMSEGNLKAKLRLAEAYIGLKKYSEAILSTQEVAKMATNFPLLDVNAKLLEGNARLALKDAPAAQQILFKLDLAKKKVQNIPQVFVSKIFLLNIRFNLFNCEKLSHALPLDEGQVRAHFKEEGQCIMNTLNALREETSKSISSHELNEARNSIVESLKTHFQWTEVPPPAAKKLTRAENTEYVKELKTVLSKDFQIFFKDFLDITKKLESKTSSDFVAPIKKLGFLNP